MIHTSMSPNFHELNVTRLLPQGACHMETVIIPAISDHMEIELLLERA